MPVYINTNSSSNLSRFTNSEISLATRSCPPSPGTAVYTTLTSINFIPTVPSVSNPNTPSPTVTSLNHAPEATTTAMLSLKAATNRKSGVTADHLESKVCSNSPYYAPSPHYSSTSSLNSPTSYRESSCTPLSESVSEIMFLPSDQRPCFPHDFSATAVSGPSPALVGPTVVDNYDKEQSNIGHGSPPHQPLTILSSVASLLPNHQHTSQESDNIVVPSMIQTSRLQTQQSMHPPQSICLSQPWDNASPHTHRLTPPIPAPTTSTATPQASLQCTDLLAVPLHSPFSWPMSLAMSSPTSTPPTPTSSYPLTSPINNTSSSIPYKVRTLKSNAPPLSPNTASHPSSPSTRCMPFAPSISFTSTRRFPIPSGSYPVSSRHFILPCNAHSRPPIPSPTIPPPTEQQIHQIYQLHQQRYVCECSSPLKRKQYNTSSPSRRTKRQVASSDASNPMNETAENRGGELTNYSSISSNEMYTIPNHDDVNPNVLEHNENIASLTLETLQERVNLNPSRKRIRGPNAGVRRSAVELDDEEFADRGLARILVYADDELQEMVAQQNVSIREPHIYDADMMDLYCLSRGDGIPGRHTHTGDHCLRNRMGCRVALAVRYAYQSDLNETHLLWVNHISRRDIPISIIMSFPACGKLIMRALKDDPTMDEQYRILCKQGYSDPPKSSTREYGKIASLNRISWMIAYQNQGHMATQALGFLQRASQAYQGAMGQPSRGMLKKRKMRAIFHENTAR